MGSRAVSAWQLASLISLSAWMVLAVRALRGDQPSASFVTRSILIWGAIVLVVGAIVLNLEWIKGALAPIAERMP